MQLKNYTMSKNIWYKAKNVWGFFFGLWRVTVPDRLHSEKWQRNEVQMGQEIVCSGTLLCVSLCRMLISQQCQSTLIKYKLLPVTRVKKVAVPLPVLIFIPL